MLSHEQKQNVNDVLRWGIELARTHNSHIGSETKRSGSRVAGFAPSVLERNPFPPLHRRETTPQALESRCKPGTEESDNAPAARATASPSRRRQATVVPAQHRMRGCCVVVFESDGDATIVPVVLWRRPRRTGDGSEATRSWIKARCRGQLEGANCTPTIRAARGEEKIARVTSFKEGLRDDTLKQSEFQSRETVDKEVKLCQEGVSDGAESHCYP